MADQIICMHLCIIFKVQRNVGPEKMHFGVRHVPGLAFSVAPFVPRQPNSYGPIDTDSQAMACKRRIDLRGWSGQSGGLSRQ